MPRHFTFDYEERTQLRDGTAIVVRLLRPDDKQLLLDGFLKLSAESRYARFFAPKQTLTDDELRYLCEIDQETHFAIGAYREIETGPIGLGIARFIALADTPTTAEAAIAVADEAQGRGLGRLLFLRLCAAALERGVTRFRCEVLGSNASMKHLLDAIAPDQDVEVTQGVCTFEVNVPEVDAAQSIATAAPDSPMYRLFRAAAENMGDWTETIKKLWTR